MENSINMPTEKSQTWFVMSIFGHKDILYIV